MTWPRPAVIAPEGVAQATASGARLFTDEAGQMSLASVLAVVPAATSIVLLGDTPNSSTSRNRRATPPGWTSQHSRTCSATIRPLPPISASS